MNVYVLDFFFLAGLLQEVHPKGQYLIVFNKIFLHQILLLYKIILLGYMDRTLFVKRILCSWCWKEKLTECDAISYKVLY